MACRWAGLIGPLPASLASAASPGVPGISRGMKKLTVTAAHSVAVAATIAIAIDRMNSSGS